MTEDTLTLLASQVSTGLDKSDLLSNLVQESYHFLFENNLNNQTKKYLQRLGLIGFIGGALTAGRHLVRYAWEGVKYVKSRLNFNPQGFKDRFGVKYWTLIVGADTSLGSCFSRELARMGFDLILVGTNTQTLRENEKEVKALNPYIKTKRIFVDLFYRNAKEVIEREIEGLDIGLVINNGHFFAYQSYDKMPKKTLLDCQSANCNITLDVCQLLVPRMKSRPHPSGIINIVSGFGVIPAPYTGLFSASQCYTDTFSRSLSKQLKGKVDVLSMREFSVFKSQLKAPERHNNDYMYVSSALKSLGKQDTSYASFGYQRYTLDRSLQDSLIQLENVDRDVRGKVPAEYLRI